MEETVSANAECVSASPTSLAAHAIVLWTLHRVWHQMGRFAMEEEPANVAPVTVQIPNSKAPHVKCVKLALESVQSTRTAFNAELSIREKRRKHVLRNACIST